MLPEATEQVFLTLFHISDCLGIFYPARLETLKRGGGGGGDECVSFFFFFFFFFSAVLLLAGEGTGISVLSGPKRPTDSYISRWIWTRLSTSGLTACGTRADDVREDEILWAAGN